MFEKNKWLLLALGVGMVLRISVIFFCLEDKIYWQDGLEYDGLAMRLVEGQGFVNENGAPTAFRPPGYPVFLASVYGTFGHHLWIVRILQSLIDCATIVIIYRIANLIFNKKIAILSAFLYAGYPLLIYTSTTFFPTTVFTFGVALSIHLTLKMQEKPDLLKSFILGIVSGMSMLFVPTFLVLLTILCIWLFFLMHIPLTRKLIYLATIFTALSISLYPWLNRNDRIYGKPFLMATNSGFNFWLGNRLWVGAKVAEQNPIPESFTVKLTNADSEIDIENLYYEESFRFIRQNPRHFLKLYFLKAMDLWRFAPAPITGYKIYPRLSKIMSMFSYGPILILSVYGMSLSRKKNKKHVLLFLSLFLALTATYALFITKVRFRLPLDPYLILFASYAISFLMDYSKRIHTQFDQRRIQSS